MRDSLTVAQEILGKLIVREIGNKRLVCRIVETEAYNQEDPASHSFRGKTARTAPMFEAGGVAYVYFIYGMYNCFNVVTDGEGYGSAVLIRAAEPISGLHLMWQSRFPQRVLPDIPDKHRPADIGRQTQRAIASLTNGPGKLARALGLTISEHNGVDLQSGELTIREDGFAPDDVIKDVRIGISAATDKMWRFYLSGNPYISRKQRQKE